MKPYLISAALCFSLIFPRLYSADASPPLPEGVNELPRDLSLRLKELLKSAEDYRGLKCLHGVPSGSLSEDALRKKVKKMFADELPPAKMHSLEAALKAFGFIPETMDLKTYYPQLLTSQIGGFYDPRQQYLIIVQREGGLCGKEVAEKFGPAYAKRMEETVMVHEFTHAIQDQHFNLKKYVIEDPLSDVAAAHLAVVEGDATLTMYDYFSNMRMEDLPMISQLIKTIMRDPKQLIAMSPDMPGSKEMADAPAWFRDTMLFSYLQGFIFCIEAKKAGGQALLDAAFQADPPRSTEQILHPEKWLGERDDPIEIALGDYAPKLPGYAKVSEGTLGELGIRTLLNEALHDPDKGAAAASDWGGDRYAVYEQGTDRVLCWVTDWDTPEAAVRFTKAASSLGEGWNIKSAGAKRVTLVHAKIAADVQDALQLALAQAPASRPANAKMDLAALGVKPRTSTSGKLDILNGQGGPDIDNLINDPRIGKMFDELGKKEGMGELSGVLNNPLTKNLMKGMLKQMLKQEVPVGKLSEDGRSYANAATGLSVQLPASAKGWTIDAKPQIPLALLVIQSPNAEISVSVIQQPMPVAMPIESMGPILEMGIGMMIKDYKKIDGKVVGEGAQKGFELQYTGKPSDEVGPVQAIQRVYLQNGNMLVISAIGGEKLWPKFADTVRAVLDGFTIAEPKAEQPPNQPKKAD